MAAATSKSASRLSPGRLQTNMPKPSSILGGSDLPLDFGADDLAFQAEIQLAAGGDPQPAADFNGNDDLTFVRDGNSLHGGVLFLLGKKRTE
jgi:hypothetical protein